MSDNKPRPNAKYRLSKENPNPIEEEKLKFYYDRKHRLDKASDTVKKLYEEPKKGFSLFRPLVADKPRATVFFTIIILCVVIITLSLLGFTERTYLLDGNKLDIKAFRYENTSIIVLKKTIDSREPYTGAVDIGVSPASSDENFPVFMHRVYFSLREEEESRFVVPYDSPKLAMVLQTEKSSLKITITSE